MPTINRFEDIEAWQEARALAKAIYQVTDDGRFCRDFGLRDQIRRAAVSVMSNIAEGFERDGNKEFARFLFIAKGSAGEIRSQLIVATDVGYLNQSQADDLVKMIESVSRRIGAFIKYLRATSQR